MTPYFKKIAASILDDIFPVIEQKTKLFFGMFIAANSAAAAIYAALFLAHFQPDYYECLGFFLAARVVLFMANPSMPLNDNNVAFMSQERILWNLATLTISFVMILSRLLIDWIFN